MQLHYLKDLAEIVNIDSGSFNPVGVTHVAEIMKKHFEDLGFYAELMDFGSDVGKGLFATNKPQSKQWDLMLNAHLDTVFPQGTADERPFSLKADIATGPGVSDCKSGVMSIFYALKACDAADLDKLAVAVCYNPDEEISSLHSRDWLQSVAKRSRQAFVFEAARSQGCMVRSRKGRSVWKITVRGIAAHAGNNPKAGRSAILAAAKMIAQINALQDLDGKGTSVNIGRIEGGTLPNVIPESCTMTIDTRFWNDADGEQLNQELENLAKTHWGGRHYGSSAAPFVVAGHDLYGAQQRSCRPREYSSQDGRLYRTMDRCRRRVGCQSNCASRHACA